MIYKILMSFLIVFHINILAVQSEVKNGKTEREKLSFLDPEKSNETCAEKLGFASGKKVILLHIDDAGMCQEANVATERYIANKQVISTAVMMPCIYANTFIEWAKNHPDADIGVHLTLTSEWKDYRWGPVSDPKKVPGLIDSEGKFFRTVADVLSHASPEEVEIEIRAQIEKFKALGLSPSHIDTHMGTLYGSAEFLKVFMKVAKEYNLPANVIEPSPRVLNKYKERGTPISNDIIKLLEDYSLPKLDDFVGVPGGKTYKQVRANFFAMIKSLKPGLTEIFFHPAIETDYLKTITKWWQQRTWEGELFLDPKVHQFFKDEGIVITNWKEIMKAYEKGNISK